MSGSQMCSSDSDVRVRTHKVIKVERLRGGTVEGDERCYGEERIGGGGDEKRCGNV